MAFLKHSMCMQVADRKCWINQSLLFVINITDQILWSSFLPVELAVIIWSMNDAPGVETKRFITVFMTVACMISTL